MNHGQVINILSEFRPLSAYAEEYTSLANYAQLDYMNQCVEAKKEPSLLPFKVNKGVDSDTPPLYVSALGLATLPSDYRPYQPFEAFSYFYNSKQVLGEFVDNKTFEYRKNHPTETPTERYPIGCIHAGYIKFLPRNLQYVNFEYLRNPTEVYLSLSNLRGFAEYYASTSVEFEWNDQDMVYIIQLILNLMNIPSTIEQINNLKNQKK